MTGCTQHAQPIDSIDNLVSPFHPIVGVLCSPAMPCSIFLSWELWTQVQHINRWEPLAPIAMAPSVVPCVGPMLADLVGCLLCSAQALSCDESLKSTKAFSSLDTACTAIQKLCHVQHSFVKLILTSVSTKRRNQAMKSLQSQFRNNR